MYSLFLCTSPLCFSIPNLELLYWIKTGGKFQESTQECFIFSSAKTHPWIQCVESTTGPRCPTATASGGSTLSLTRVLQCLCQLSAPPSRRLEVDVTAPHSSFPIVLFPWVSRSLSPDKLQKDNGIWLQVKMTAGTDFFPGERLSGQSGEKETWQHPVLKSTSLKEQIYPSL